jgi:molecular chaperone IbpA
MSLQLPPANAADFANLSRILVGFDRYLNSHPTNRNYPPHNIVRYDKNRYGIEVAVAGFAKEEIAVEIDQDQLIIRGKHTILPAEGVEFLHRGLAARDFEQWFTLAEYIEVQGAEVKDGMLKIELIRNVPDALKPRIVDIK